MADQNQAQDDGFIPAGETVGSRPIEVTGEENDGYLVALYGGRPKNPLNEYASFTYKLILYMVTAEAYIRFIESGMTYIGTNEGFFTVAESGGTPSQSDAPRINENAEYFIDDLTFKTFCNTKATESATNSINFEFKIYEPMGFSFTSVLKQRALEAALNSGLPGIQDNKDSIKQFYVLSISFLGYDDAGNAIKEIIPGRESGLYSGTGSGQTGTKVGSNASFFPLSITDFSFRLDGKSTVYTIKATPLSVQEAYGVKRNQIPEDRQVSGTTVGEVLVGNEIDADNPNARGIVQIMNEREQQLYNNGKAKYTNSYHIEIDDAIKYAKLTSQERYDKVKAEMGSPTTSGQISAKDSRKNLTYNPNTRTLAIAGGMTLTKFIDNVILQSEYITKALDTVYTEDGILEDKPASGNKGSKILDWYSINPVVKPKGYDSLRNDYVFDITYYVAPYKIPYVKSVFIEPESRSDYYGPYKVYNYYFTGQNTEVLNFETSYNALYFLPGGSDDQKEKPNDGLGNTPIVPGSKNIGSELNASKGGIPIGSIKTNLYSPGDQIKAKLQIMGDPDYLMTSIGTAKNASTPREAAYTDNLQINPLGGQIFIEINFYEGLDYNISTGLLTINKNITFYDNGSQPQNALMEQGKQNVSGLVYMVLSVTSSLTKGRFTQDLDLVLWTDPTVRKTTSVTAEGRETTTNQAEQLGTNTYGFGNQEFPVNSSSQSQQTTPDTYWQPTEQSITNRLVTDDATPAESTVGSNVGVAFNQQRAFNSSVVDDDSLQSSNLVSDFIRVNQEGRAV
jgi:hypothetical protein